MVSRPFRIIAMGIIALLATLFLGVATADARECALEVAHGSSGCNEQLSAPMFAAPDPFEDSLFGRVIYGKLADNANVYPQSSRLGAPSRNVGDGFLYATVSAIEEVDGSTWYRINHGEFVHEDDLEIVRASDFQGVVVNRQPERPFGWVVQDVRPSSEPDGEPDPTFAKMPRYTLFQIYDAVKADDEWIWYDLGSGRWVRQTYLSIVDVSPRPEGVGPNDFWTEVDLYEQTFAAYEGDRMVYATLISSGLNRWPTREGLFQVWSRFEQVKMSGAEGQEDYYFLEDIPYTMYFDPLVGIALHGTYWHDRFGFKHSHGCVNMPILDAEYIFNWSASAPNDLWVWVHTTDPGDYFN